MEPQQATNEKRRVCPSFGGGWLRPSFSVPVGRAFTFRRDRHNGEYDSDAAQLHFVPGNCRELFADALTLKSDIEVKLRTDGPMPSIMLQYVKGPPEVRGITNCHVG